MPVLFFVVRLKLVRENIFMHRSSIIVLKNISYLVCVFHYISQKRRRKQRTVLGYLITCSQCGVILNSLVVLLPCNLHRFKFVSLLRDSLHVYYETLNSL